MMRNFLLVSVILSVFFLSVNAKAPEDECSSSLVPTAVQRMVAKYPSIIMEDLPFGSKHKDKRWTFLDDDNVLKLVKCNLLHDLGAFIVKHDLNPYYMWTIIAAYRYDLIIHALLPSIKSQKKEGEWYVTPKDRDAELMPALRWNLDESTVFISHPPDVSHALKKDLKNMQVKKDDTNLIRVTAAAKETYREAIYKGGNYEKLENYLLSYRDALVRAIQLDAKVITYKNFEKLPEPISVPQLDWRNVDME